MSTGKFVISLLCIVLFFFENQYSKSLVSLYFTLYMFICKKKNTNEK